jgi:antitoxin HigA-1
LIITGKKEKVEKLPLIHPGEVLLEDFMKPLGLSYYRLARELGVSAIRISQIARGKRTITADTAMRLARYFGTSAEVWLRMQARYDLEVAQEKAGERINREVRILNQNKDNTLI